MKERIFYRIRDEARIFIGLRASGDTFGGLALMSRNEFAIFANAMRQSIQDGYEKLHFFCLSERPEDNGVLMIVGMYLRIYPATLLDVVWKDRNIDSESLFANKVIVDDVMRRSRFVPVANYISGLWIPDPYWRNSYAAEEKKAEKLSVPDPFRDVIANLSALDTL